MQRARSFSTYVARTPAELAVMATAEATASSAAIAAGDAISVVTEEDKEIRERDVNKFVDQNRQYNPAQVFSGRTPTSGEQQRPTHFYLSGGNRAHREERHS